MTPLLIPALLALLATAPKPDTLWNPAIYAQPLTVGSGMDTTVLMKKTAVQPFTITYHSLSQLPKDTTKRWEISLSLRWGMRVDSSVAGIWGKNGWKPCRIDTTWLWLPDSAISEAP